MAREGEIESQTEIMIWPIPPYLFYSLLLLPNDFQFCLSIGSGSNQNLDNSWHNRRTKTWTHLLCASSVHTITFLCAVKIAALHKLPCHFAVGVNHQDHSGRHVHIDSHSSTQPIPNASIILRPVRICVLFLSILLIASHYLARYLLVCLFRSLGY